MVYRNKDGRLGAGFISLSVCGLETRWLGQKLGFHVPGSPCNFFMCSGSAAVRAGGRA